MNISNCTFAQAPEILAIFNDAILHSTALYEYQPRTLAFMQSWFEAKQKGSYPVLGAFDQNGALAGFASYGPFRSFAAYKYTLEHSVYVHPARRGCGLGRQLLQSLIEAARQQGYHTMLGGIDSSNLPSVRLHLSLGFVHCASIKQAGFKFGRWLDLEFYQLLLPTPATPTEG
jgi:L-amino acid N-acyltransferase